MVGLELSARRPVVSTAVTGRRAQALPNIHVLRLLRLGHALVDCVSEGERERALAAGFRTGLDPAEIAYTTDILTEATIERLVALQVPLNAGSEDMLTQIGRRSRGHRVWLRINPGFGHGHSKKVNTGGESSKHGIWHANIADALARIDEFELDLVGLHLHIGSGADLLAVRATFWRDGAADRRATGANLPNPYARQPPVWQALGVGSTVVRGPVLFPKQKHPT